jgi:hypothetical protein
VNRKHKKNIFQPSQKRLNAHPDKLVIKWNIEHPKVMNRNESTLGEDAVDIKGEKPNNK